MGATSARFAYSSNRSSDFILAACDVEGNFLVVKAYQYTNLLSCMLLNSYALFSPSELQVLTIALEQMGDHVVLVLLVGVHADQIYLDPAHCMRSTSHPISFSTNGKHVRVS